MKIKVTKINFGLNEIGHGAVEMRFALINPETGETLTPFCRCKDYFSDVFWSNATGNNASIYGFNWKANEDKGILKQDTITVAINLTERFESKRRLKPTEEEAKNLERFLNHFNKALKFRDTEVSFCDDGTHLIITSDRKWTDIPYMVSAYFMLIRLGIKYNDYEKDPVSFYSEKKTADFLSPNDEGYFRKIKNRILDLQNGKIDKKQTFKQYETTSQTHSYSGLLNYKEYKID